MFGVDKKVEDRVGERLQNPPITLNLNNRSMIEFENPEVNLETDEGSLQLEVFRYVIGPGFIE